MPESQEHFDVICIGGGPAGLTASYLLSKKDKSVAVFEADEEYLGGIARTVVHNGFRFDIGGHRFFSKSQAVEDLWSELLGDELLTRARSSRIFYRGKFFSYPLQPFEALLKLGLWESLRCGFSYLKARAFPVKNPANFEQWVSNSFGKRLFQIFFKTYTEKVWGMSCTEISADWAAQRIKGLSLSSAILSAFKGKGLRKNRSEVIKTLITSFRYPRLGPGMMWEVAAQKTEEHGGRVLMGHSVYGLEYHSEKGSWTVQVRKASGEELVFSANHVISSAPVRELVANIAPQAPAEVQKAAASLNYRDFLIVALMIEERDLFDDCWIYIHDSSVKVGRIQNFKAWSPEMVPDQKYACYGLEYFCFEGDELWDSSDEKLIELARAEFAKLGFVTDESDIFDSSVCRIKKAYPVYDHNYATNVALIREELEKNYPNLHLVGRNGMHKYNNQDHAMMTAMLTVENILAEEEIYDVWRVNQDAEYHESDEDHSKALDRWQRTVVPTRANQAG